jgi:cytochrome P450
VTALAEPLADELTALLSGRPDLVADPYPLLRRVRQESPVLRCGPYTVVSGYRDVSGILQNPLAVKVYARAESFIASTPADKRHLAVELIDWYRTWLSQSNGAQHRRLRGLVHQAFTPRTVGAIQADVQSAVEELLDAVDGHGGADVIADLAFHLPLIVICRMLDIPVAERFNIHENAKGFAQLVGGVPGVDAPYAAMTALKEHLGGLIEQRRGRSTTPLLQALFDAEQDGERLSNDELVTMIVHLVFGGHDTTTNLIGNGLLALLTHRDQWDRLCAEPGLATGAVEELLRFNAPVQETHRAFERDVEVHGVTIRAGEMVRVLLGAANRDENVYQNPDTLDITRTGIRHLSFGEGPHYCLGASLTRMEGATVFATLSRRYPRMRLATEPDRLSWYPYFSLHGLTSLPITFDPDH